MVAPIDGTLTVVASDEGEFAAPGQVVMVVSDMSELRIDTTYLSVRDVARAEIGQRASVYLEALDEEVGGQVASIPPVADTLGGDSSNPASE